LTARTFFERRGLTLLIAALVIYGCAFILRSSLVIEGVRYFCLLDDPMISMRYAKNLALGHGLVWNIGERIEGFTNPLWTLYMSLWHHLPIEPHMMSLPIQLTSLVALVALAILTYSISKSYVDSNGLRIIATAFAVFYFPMIMWSLLGMEVGLITAGLMIAVKWTLDALERDQFDARIYLLLGILTLVRMDALIFAIAISVFLAYHQRRLKTKHVAAFAAMALVFIGGQTLWRYSYYGEFLPNTYYLKATGYPIIYRWTRGLYALYHFLQQPNLLIALAPIAYALWKRTQETNLLLVLIGIATAYSIYVGGDAWEEAGGANRYLLPVMPLYFILLFRMIEELWQRVGEHTRVKRWGLAIPIVLLYLGFNTPNVTAYNPNSLEDLLLLGKPYAVREHAARIEQAKWIDEHTTPKATIAVAWAGITPYFAERKYFDMYGKVDPVISRLEAKPYQFASNLTAFFPGHNKWNYGYTLGALKPDIITGLIEHAPRPENIEQAYYEYREGDVALWIRQGSNEVDTTQRATR
jgi:hypothetical protein